MRNSLFAKQFTIKECGVETQSPNASGGNAVFSGILFSALRGLAVPDCTPFYLGYQFPVYSTSPCKEFTDIGDFFKTSFGRIFTAYAVKTGLCGGSVPCRDRMATTGGHAPLQSLALIQA
jgi:hypothetical protein